MQRADGYFHGHPLRQLSYLRLVYVAAEDEVAHVRHGGYCRTVVERVAQDYRVADLHRHVQYEAAYGRADERAARACIAARHSVAHYLERVDGRILLLLRLFEGLPHVVVLLRAYQLLVEKLLFAPVVHLRLLQVDVRQAHSGFRGAKLAHVGYHLDLGYHFAGLDRLSGLFVDVRDDSAYLRLHFHFVARLDGAGDYRCLVDVGHLRSELVVGHRLRLRLLVEKHERADEHQGYQCRGNDFQILFHVLLVDKLRTDKQTRMFYSRISWRPPNYEL